MRQGRKAVSLVTNFEQFGVDADSLAEDMRRTCAAQTSGTSHSHSGIPYPTNILICFKVTPVQGKAQSEVMVQGKQETSISDYFISKGVPKKWIVVEDTTSKGK